MSRWSGYYSMAELKARGWTDALIRDELGEPNRLEPNPKVLNGSEMKLYDKKRVLGAERRKAVAPRIAEKKVRLQAKKDAKQAEKDAEELELKNFYARKLAAGIEEKSMAERIDERKQRHMRAASERFDDEVSKHMLSEAIRVFEAAPGAFDKRGYKYQSAMLKAIADSIPELEGECDTLDIILWNQFQKRGF